MRNTEERQKQFESWDINYQKHWCCEDCDKNCFTTETNYYMLTDQLWSKYGVGDGMLCLNCLEKRIGRKLKYEDFTDCPLNEWNEFVQNLK